VFYFPSLQRGRVVLPDLAVTDSSEALLSGRKPPFRLVVRAKHKRGQHISLRPAVSEAFVVATRRVKTSHKVCHTVQCRVVFHSVPTSCIPWL
jgi:hypothetical protein